MAENSGISWTDHTFNPWWGCVKISPACTNCYAATFDHRLGGSHWGPKSDRKFFGEKHWNEPKKWNARAKERGVRERVFCASMADVFEDRPDLVEHRVKLWRLIDITPNLDWLLLTKRPENIERMLPGAFMRSPARDWHREPWPNVWLGTTVENQEYAIERIPRLLSVPAVVHFLSCEPLLGALHLGAWMQRLSWVIVGCESGHGARHTDTNWLRIVRDQCAADGVPFLLKQATDNGAKEVTVYRKPLGDVVLPSIWAGGNSKTKGGGVIELPYLDGLQHAAFPVPA